MNKYFVIFGGGGIRGIAYSGAHRALIENDIEITGYAGSSIGSLYAALASLGYTYDEIYKILSDTGFDLFRDINIGFKKEVALSKGKVFLNWLRERIEEKFYGENYKKGFMPPVKFSDIDKNLVIYSVDLSNMKFKEFSSRLTPDFEIALAVRASVSMPGLFVPLELDGNLIVDGDLMKSSPLWRLSETVKNLDEKILEFRLEDTTKPKFENTIDYLNAVYNALQGFATDYVIDLYKNRDKFDYIKINTPSISVVDFLIPKEKKRELYEIGYSTTNSYFRKIYPQKRKMLTEKYKKLLDCILKFQKEFLKKNAASSYLALTESFLFLCEEKKYIDAALYKKLCNFKDRYLENCRQSSFLRFKRTSFKNKNELADELLEIIKALTLKITP